MIMLLYVVHSCSFHPPDVPSCPMVLEYLPAFTLIEPPSHVSKYTSTVGDRIPQLWSFISYKSFTTSFMDE